MEIAIIALIAAAAVSAVIYPLVSGSAGSVARLSEESLDQEVARYREALRKRTLCERCLAANPAGSKFCADCGRPLG